MAVTNVMLKDISEHLDSNGNIKSSNHIDPIINLMKQTEKVSHCCAFINILKRTLLNLYGNNQTSIIDAFLQKGGLHILFKWLNTAKTIADHRLMRDLLDLYKELPLNMDILLLNLNSLELITSIANSDQINSECRMLAKEIGGLWRKLTSSIMMTNKSKEFYNQSSTTNKPTINSCGQTGSTLEQDTTRNSHKEIIGDDHGNKNVNSNFNEACKQPEFIKKQKNNYLFDGRLSGSIGSESIYLSSDTSNDSNTCISETLASNELKKSEYADKEMIQESNITQFLTSHDGESEKSSKRMECMENGNFAQLEKVTNFSSNFKIPKRSRNDASLPSPEKKIKKVEMDIANDIDSNKADNRKSRNDGSKDKIHYDSKKNMNIHHSVKKAKLQENAMKIKISKNETQDSDGFLAALNSVTDSRPIRHSSSNFSKPGLIQKAVENKKANTNDTNIEISNSNIKEQKPEESQFNIFCVESLNVSKAILKSNLVSPGSKKNVKKRLSWADACFKQLEQIYTFVLDDNERATKKPAFKGDISKIEKLNEREMLNSIKSFNEEGNEEPWPSLIPIELPDSIIIPEIKSEESKIQAQRELNTLALLVFKQFLPDSASEPDFNENEMTPSLFTRIIPLDDGNSVQNNLISDFIKEEMRNNIDEIKNESNTIGSITFNINFNDKTNIKKFSNNLDVGNNSFFTGDEVHSNFMKDSIYQKDCSSNSLKLITKLPTDNLLPSDEATEHIKSILKQIETHQVPVQSNEKNLILNDGAILETSEKVSKEQKIDNILEIEKIEMFLNQNNDDHVMHSSKESDSLTLNDKPTRPLNARKRNYISSNFQFHRKQKSSDWSSHNQHYSKRGFQKDRNVKEKEPGLRKYDFNHRYDKKTDNKPGNISNTNRNKNLDIVSPSNNNNGNGKSNSEKVVVNKVSGCRWI